MVYFTLKMFHDKSILREKAVWARLVNIFQDKQNTQDDVEVEKSGESEDLPKSEQKETDLVNGSRFITVSWDPYINFFISLFFFLFSLGIGEKVVPNSILFCGISVFFAALCFVALADNTDHFALIALVANSLSW